jgi:hypothetical protein
VHACQEALDNTFGDDLDAAKARDFRRIQQI